MSIDREFSRRDFVKSAVAAGTGILVAGSGAVRANDKDRKRYALVGTGHRGTSMWGVDLAKRYPDKLEFVGLCDKNPKRALAGRALIGVDCPTFTDFDEMLAKTKPEILMVTTVDSTHHQFITKALAKGIKVMTEKPMVTEASQCQAVLDAERAHKNPLVVTFNYRYSPKHEKIKQIISSGEIGEVTSVDFSWYLDTSHGADYFRRWHRLKSGGGSLWVHKATHHFDLINWWLAADPVEVSAYGALNVYGKKGTFRGKNCRNCEFAPTCSFHWDLRKNERLMKLYAECEDVDNYYRDGCVFREDCDIYDTMSAIVKYDSGVSMSYSLNAAMPYEGYQLSFNGTKGRFDIRDFERQPWKVERPTVAYLTKNFSGKRVEIEMPTGNGGHGGGDDRLRDIIFRDLEVPDYWKLPSARAGAMSCLTGIAARTSIEQSRPIKIGELVKFT